VRALPENVTRDAALPGGAVQGVNDYDRCGYDGPCPPPGRPHHYHFKVFALDARLALDASARKADLMKAMRGHVLAQGDLVGTYARKAR
ncbi:MAG TPA: YbhB/YbcL family Raf kinase inhibitor-like protein, partial [Kiritimatiellia bacterium]|nr:YbhB/YbcL family Raf kinase inhibitor-like protein [Kiritimatiellia bacterium]